MIIYSAALCLLSAATAWSLATRIPLKVNVLKDHGTLSREADDGRIENIYALKIINTGDQTRTFRLGIAGFAGLRLENDQPVTVSGGDIGRQTLVVSADPGSAKSGASGTPRAEMLPVSGTIVSLCSPTT